MFYLHKLNLHALPFVLCALFLGGCSSTTHQLKGPFEYTKLDVSENNALRVPKPFHTPIASHTYHIPQLSPATDNFPLGIAIEARSPIVLWPILKGSRVIDTSTGPAIEISATHASQNLTVDSLHALKAFLNTYQIQILREDMDAGTLVSAFSAELVQDWVKVIPDELASATLTWQIKSNKTLQTTQIQTVLDAPFQDPADQAFVKQRAQNTVLNTLIEYLKKHEETAT